MGISCPALLSGVRLMYLATFTHLEVQRHAGLDEGNAAVGRHKRAQAAAEGADEDGADQRDGVVGPCVDVCVWM